MSRFLSLLVFLGGLFGSVGRDVNAQNVDPLPLLPGQPSTDPKALGTANENLVFWRWWMLAQDSILDLKRNLVQAADPRTGYRRVLQSDLERVLAALMSAQADSSSAVRAAAALALGKSTERAAIAALLRPPEGGSFAPLFDPAFEVRRAAILGLGAAQNDSTLATLADIVKDAKFEAELKAAAAIAIGAIEFRPSSGPAAVPVVPAAGGSPSVEWLDPHAIAPSAVAISALAIDSARQRAAIGFADGRIALWQLDRDKLGTEWKAHNGPVTAIAFTGDGERMVSVSSVGSLRIRVLKSATDNVRIDGLGGLTSIALDAKEQWVVAGNVEGEVVVLPMSGKKEYLERRPTHAGAVSFVGYSVEHDEIVSTGADGLVKLQELRAKSTSRVLSSRAQAIRSAALRRDGRFLLLGLEDGKLERLALDRGEEATWVYLTEGGAPQSLGFDDRGEHCLVVDANGKVELRVDATGLVLAEFGVNGVRATIGADLVVVADGKAGAHARRFETRGAAGVPDAAAPGGAASDPAAVDARRTVLLTLLEEKSFLAADPLVQDGIAIAAGLTRDPGLLPAVIALVERGRDRAKGLSAPTLGFLAVSAARLLVASGNPGEDGALLLKLAQKDDLATVRRAAVYGLGILFAGSGGQERAGSVVSALISRLELSSGESDRAVKNAIYVALGRIGGDIALRYLRKEIQSTEGRSSVTPGASAPRLGFSEVDSGPFQAVALAFGKDPGGYSLAEHKFKHEGSLGYRCALALALGIHGPSQRSANPELLAAFKKEKSPPLIAHLALGLGLARVLDGKSLLLSRLADEKVDVTVIPQLAIGAALLEVPPNREMPSFLATLFRNTKSPPRGAALAFSLGLVGDVHSVEPLLLSLENKKLPTEVRVACVTALGMLLDPSVESTLARLRADLDAVNEPRLLAALGVFENY